MTTINPTGTGSHFCRPCNRRFETGGRCDRCGTLRTAWYEPKRPAVKCPACGCGMFRETADGPVNGSRVCTQCHAEFEPVEVSFCDSRPDVNAEKREEFERRRFARQCAGRRRNRD